MLDVEGFILVGGESRRMGTDKAALSIDGQTSLQRVAAAVSAVSFPVTLVGARREYDGVTLRNVPDIHEKWGALGGIHAALAKAEKTWALIVACDLPFVTAELFERLKSFVNEDTDAIVPIQPDARPQPLCALYRRKTCLPETETLIAADEHTPRALLTKMRTRRIEYDEINDLNRADRFFLNLNTASDFEQAQEFLSSKSPRRR
jgi:molybdopterin-guanine dinucleotide biosynthesis protein A